MSGVCFSTVKHAQDVCTVSGAGLSTVLKIHRMPIWCLVFVSVQCETCTGCLYGVWCLFQYNVKHAQDALMVSGVCFSVHVHRIFHEC